MTLQFWLGVVAAVELYLALCHHDRQEHLGTAVDLFWVGIVLGASWWGGCR
jgi:hypothetical protein